MSILLNKEHGNEQSGGEGGGGFIVLLLIALLLISYFWGCDNTSTGKKNYRLLDFIVTTL